MKLLVTSKRREPKKRIMPMVGSSSHRQCSSRVTKLFHNSAQGQLTSRLELSVRMYKMRLWGNFSKDLETELAGMFSPKLHSLE